MRINLATTFLLLSILLLTASGGLAKAASANLRGVELVSSATKNGVNQCSIARNPLPAVVEGIISWQDRFHSSSVSRPLPRIFSSFTQPQLNDLTNSHAEALSIYFAGLAVSCIELDDEQRDRLIALAEHYSDTEPVIQVLEFQCQYYSQRREWRKALQSCQTLIDRSADVNQMWLLRLAIVYRELGNHEDAITILNKVSPLSSVDMVRVLTLMGHSYLLLGEVDRAEEILAQAESLWVVQDADVPNPLSAQLFFYRGLVQDQYGNVSKARSYFEKSLSFEPTYSGSLVMLAKYALSQSNYALADHYLQQVSPTLLNGPQVLCMRYTTSLGLARHEIADDLQHQIDTRGIRCP